MAEPLTGNLLVAQSGGPTAVINASACGVIEACRQAPDQIGKVYAGHNGIIGALTEDDTGKPEVCMYNEDGPPRTRLPR